VTAPGPARGRALPTAALFAAAVLLTLGGLEAGFRLARVPVGTVQINRATVRRSPNPRLGFELRPGAVAAAEVDYRINAAGLRGPEVEEEKSAGVVRVAVLGDSIAFGYGVAEADAFPRQLEGLLNTGRRDGRAEVLNFGVPGYNLDQELEVVALFHSGQTGIGAGLPGGGGIRLKYSNPLAIDDVAADFPGLRIVIAHPSFPWQDEALAVANHKPLVHIDLSGWSPKYFPPQLVRYANTLLRDKVLFGSDFPVLTPDRWLADFDKLDMKPEVRPLILKENAARLLRLGKSDA